MQDIVVYNTLTRRKEKLNPLKPGHISIYACGVTTYDHYHIGHALQAIYFDMICNYLTYAGYDVTYVRNYTDVDDKIINRSKDLGISPKELAESIIASSEEDMRALGCREPTFSPKVSQSIPEIIAMVEDLIKNGGAYATKEGNVYYRVRSKTDYGKLSNRKVDELRASGRTVSETDKEDELDFALWKADNTPSASWPSPWGQGRPGWHIECSAMSKKHLGSSFDIHGGGLDLIFPHHENEIAQSESANKCSYATYWLHSGLLTIEKQKMSKSIGNHINLKDFLKKWPAESLRLAYLQYHYGSNIDFSNDTFKNAHKRLYYYYSTLLQLDELAAQASDGITPEGFDVTQVRASFHTALSDDFNSGLALAELNNQFKKANELFTKKNSPQKFATAKAMAAIFRELFKVFGMLQADAASSLETLRTMILPELGITRDTIEAKIKERQAARANKDFAQADAVRKELAAAGIELMDSPQGTNWKIRHEG